MRSQIRSLAIAAALSTAVLLSGTAQFANAAALTTADPAATTQVMLTNHDCKPGYVWREARPRDYVCVAPATRSQTAYDNSQAPYRVDPNGAYGPNSCISGYVWRDAFDGDGVCVTPDVRAQAKADNAAASDRWVPLSW